MTREEEVLWNALAQFADNAADALAQEDLPAPQKARLEEDLRIAERLCGKYDAQIAALAEPTLETPNG